ncbi:MAG: hypothetical protein PWP09_1906, partial [Thermotogota bacterium]|nr:hypothetical protein [Thermotogota bacterium]
SSLTLANNYYQKDSTSCLSFLLATSMWLGNCLRKRSLGASQDLETEMCDKGRKAEKTLSAREGRVITCVLWEEEGIKTSAVQRSVRLSKLYAGTGEVKR